MVTRRFVSIRLVKPGDVIDQSIMDQTGRTLVARKSVLDEYVINALREMGITGIYLREGKEDEQPRQSPVQDEEITPEIARKIEHMKIPDRARVYLSESIKQRVESGIQFMFNSTKDEHFADAAVSVSNDLMKAVMENDAIAVDVASLKISDEYTFKHCVDVASIGMIIAKKCGMSQDKVYQVGMAGLLHDLGKSEIPNEILNKPDRLTKEEFEIMKQHSLLGYNLLKDKKEIPLSVQAGVLQHHEKANGKGYPFGVTIEKINPVARILAVADIYDALVTERPYKKGFSPRDAVEMIMAMTGELDIHVINDFLKSVILYPVGSNVKLSNGEIGKVVQNYPDYPTRPKVIGIKSGTVFNLCEDVSCSNIIVE